MNSNIVFWFFFFVVYYPASILYKSIAGRYRPVSYSDGPITARYRFIKNVYWIYNINTFWSKNGPYLVLW